MKIVISYLRGQALKAITGLAGWKLFLAKFLLTHAVKILSAVGKLIGELLKYTLQALKNRAEDERDQKRADKVDETLKDGVTEEDQDAAIDDLLNGSRK